MRRWHRPDPPQQLVAFLDRKQAEVDARGAVDSLWRTARRSGTIQALARLLASATGARERCMYCEDSHGTDIEHYRPKASHPRLAFRWLNWLWVCSGCNRSKGGRFPLDAAGAPLLIDPTAEDPWDFLFYDSATGEVTPRWHGQEEDAKGKVTVETLSPVRGQAVCEGRLRTRRHLGRAVTAFLALSEDEDAGPHIEALVNHVRDADDYGLLEWCFLREGSDEIPFSQLREERPLAWARMRQTAQNALRQ